MATRRFMQATYVPEKRTFSDWSPSSRARVHQPVYREPRLTAAPSGFRRYLGRLAANWGTWVLIGIPLTLLVALVFLWLFRVLGGVAYLTDSHLFNTP